MQGLDRSHHSKLLLQVVILLIDVALCEMVPPSKLVPTDCPTECTCENAHTLVCADIELSRIPTTWPASTYRKIVLRNTTLNTLEKNAFRRFQHLQELHIESCPNLDVIDKYAFKGLKRLRLINIHGNQRLKELFKSSFSGIGNENSVKIRIKHNGLERIHADAFRNANNLRELHIEDRCYDVDSKGFANILKVDFLTLKGACTIQEYAFANTTRVHNLNVVGSNSVLSRRSFAGLTHVHQLSIRESQMPKIEEEAFSDAFTIGAIHIQSNSIGQIEPRAFTGMENVGTLLLSYNTIREPMNSPECLLHSAQKLAFTENTLHCSCEMRWIEHHPDPTILSENYCGKEEAFKSLTYFKPVGCPPIDTPEPPVVDANSEPPPPTRESNDYPHGFSSISSRIRTHNLLLMSVLAIYGHVAYLISS